MERPLTEYTSNDVQRAEEPPSFSLLPIEIIFKLYDEYPVDHINDLINLSRSCSFLSNTFRQTSYWRDRYYREYNQHDELDADMPKLRIKIFLWSFLPTNYATNDNGYDWCHSYWRRRTYNDAIYKAVTACERTGWKKLAPKDKNQYHHPLSQTAFRFGFQFTDNIFAPLRDLAQDNTENWKIVWLKAVLNLPAMVDIKQALDLCFLHLTLDAFTADPEATLISVVDPFHFNKAYNPHIAHAPHLCSMPLPPRPEMIDPLKNRSNSEEPFITPSENIEISEYGQRRWGFYTNYSGEGLLWGEDLNRLLETAYPSEYLFDATIFAPRNEIENFGDMVQ